MIVWRNLAGGERIFIRGVVAQHGTQNDSDTWATAGNIRHPFLTKALAVGFAALCEVDLMPSGQVRPKESFRRVW